MNVELRWAGKRIRRITRKRKVRRVPRDAVRRRGRGRGRAARQPPWPTLLTRDYLRRRPFRPLVHDWFWREAERRIAIPRRSQLPANPQARRSDWHVGYLSRSSPRITPSSRGCSIVIRGPPRFGLLGWTRFHVGHGGPQSRLASTTLPSHTFHAAPHEHRLVAGAASPRKPYL